MFKTPEKRLAEIALYELVVEELEQGEAGYVRRQNLVDLKLPELRET